MTTTTATQTAEAVAEQWHFLSEFSLDPQGAAYAFQFMYGHGPLYDDYREVPALSYDSVTSVWRSFDLATGWTLKRSILLEMNEIIGAICALESFRTTDSTS